jgi:hypothetical protein
MTDQDRPLGELIAGLSRDGTLLVQQEIALAKQEMSDKLGKVASQLVGLAIGGVLLHCGILAAIGCGVLLLAAVVPAWAATLIAAVALLASGAVLVLRAKSQLSTLQLAPKALVSSLKQDARSIKEAAQ